MSLPGLVYTPSGTQWVAKGRAAVSGPGAPVAADVTVAAGGNIQAALTAAPINGTVALSPGTYRLADYGTAALTFKAGQRLVSPVAGDAVVLGSRVLTTWTASGSTWYSTQFLPSGYTDTGQCEVTSGTQANPCHKREQIFIDGVHQERVMTLATVGPGKFYQDYATGRTYIGTNPSGKLVEMSSLPYMVNSGTNGIKLDRVEWRHFATPAQQGAVMLSGSDVEVVGCTARWNHAIGLHLTTADRAWVHFNTFTHNGQLGMGCYSSPDVVIEDNEFTYNNTDGFWGGDWESGGLKVTWTDGATVRRNEVHYNEGVGIWFDIDNVNSVCAENNITHNYADGIRYEISFAGEIAYNTVRHNGIGFAMNGGRGADYSMFAVGGINVNTSKDVEVHHNTVEFNQNGIVLQWRDRGMSSTFNVPRDLAGFSVHHNVVDLTVTSGGRWGEGVNGLNTLGATNTASFYDGTRGTFDHNTYTVVALTDVKFAWDGTYKTWANYRLSGQDANGTIRVAPRAGIRIAAGGADGHWSDATPAYSSTGTVVRVGHFSASDYGVSAFLRFAAIGIPQGATIDSAYLDLRATGLSGTTPPAMTIRAAKETSAALPSSRTDVSGRPRTTASVAWSPSSWPANTWVASPSIVAVLQELVNQSGWTTGSPALVYLEAPAASFTTTQQLSFGAFENATPDVAAGLVVTWH